MAWTYKDFQYDPWTYNPFTYDAYKESASVADALKKKKETEDALANYGAFSFSKQGDYDSLFDQYKNRKDFTYDVNGDALYQQAVDKYTQLGKLAMADTMGRAAAMTGGYGNSYSQSVGQQAYQNQLDNVNDILPDLYQMALNKYNMEGQEMLNMLGMLGDERNFEYGVWGDGYNKLAADRDYYGNLYENERSWDYGKYTNERDFAYNQYSSDRALDYDKYSSDRNLAYDKYSTDKNLSYEEYRAAIADAQWQKEYSLAADKWDYEKSLAADSQKSYSGTTETGKTFNNGGLTDGQIKELQAALGVDADGKYGPKSKEAAGGLTAAEAWEAYLNGTLGKKEQENPVVGPNNIDIEGDLNRYISQGASKSEINTYLRLAKNSGHITQAQYDKLKETYAPRGNTY